MFNKNRVDVSEGDTSLQRMSGHRTSPGSIVDIEHLLVLVVESKTRNPLEDPGSPL